MKIKLTRVYVDDQEKALRFYTDVLGFTKKGDFSNGPFRWLTVASSEEPDGTELQLALNDNPAAKAYQQATFQQGQPSAMFFTDDVKADYKRSSAIGHQVAVDRAHRWVSRSAAVSRLRTSETDAHGACKSRDSYTSNGRSLHSDLTFVDPYGSPLSKSEV
jgi:catechol 2,3-dioxygenase-like lactoylglutathione lyase family enzyme